MNAETPLPIWTRILQLHGWSFLTMLLGLLLLHVVPVQALPLSGVFLFASLLALPLWKQLSEPRLLLRSVVIAACYPEQGLVARWFRSGNLLRLWYLLLAFALALLLLVIVQLLSPQEWLLLLALPFLLLLLALLSDGLCDAQTIGPWRWIFQRALIRVPALLLVVALATAAYLERSHVDLRGIDLEQRVAADVQAGLDAWQVPALGLLQGSLHAADSVAQALAQRMIPELDSWSHRLLLWGWMALKSGLALWLVVEFLLGCMALATALQGRGVPASGGRAFVGIVIGTWLLLFLLVGFLNSMKLRESRELAQLAQAQLLHCDELWAATRTALQAQQASLSRQQNAEIARVQQQAPSRIDALFRQAEPGIERWLDWRYSVTGEYLILLHSAQRLLDSEAEAQDRFAEWVLGPIEQGLAAYAAEEVERLRSNLQSAATAPQAGSLQQQLAVAGCLAAPQAFSLPTADAMVLVGQPQVAVVGLKLGALAVKKGTMKVGAKATAHAASKVAAIGSGAVAASVICGPAAPLCAIGLGVGSWFLTDKLMVEADEYLHREDEKAALLAELEARKQALTALFIEQQSLVINEQYQRLSEQFRIPEQGGLQSP